jgi:hypothetical protein
MEAQPSRRLPDGEWYKICCILAGCCVVVLAAITVYFQRNIPAWDAWEFTEVFSGQQPCTLNWLWEQHNEHHMPVQKLIAFVLARLTGWNTVWESMFTFLLIVSGGLLFLKHFVLDSAAGKKIRAFRLLCFSLLLFNPAQIYNLTWDFQIAWGVIFFFCILLAACLSRFKNDLKSFIGIAAILVVLTGTSMHGLAGHMYILGWAAACMIEKRRFLLYPFFLGLVAAGLLALYFWGFHFAAGHPPITDAFRHILQTGVYILAYIGNPCACGNVMFGIVHGLIFVCFALYTFSAAAQAKYFPGNILRFYIENPLIITGAVIMLMIAAGRVDFGVAQALSSRYVTCAILLDAGMLLYILTGMGQKSIAAPVFLGLLSLGFITGCYTAYRLEIRQHRLLAEFRSCAIGHHGDISTCNSGSVYPDMKLLQERVRLLYAKRLSFFHNAADSYFIEHEEKKRPVGR